MRRKSLIAIAATAASLIGAGSAFADTSSSTFEPPGYSHGSVAGQQGWKVLNPLFDQEIVEPGGLPAAFGEHAWRVSNTYTVGSFEDQPYSPALHRRRGRKRGQHRLHGRVLVQDRVEHVPAGAPPLGQP